MATGPPSDARAPLPDNFEIDSFEGVRLEKPQPPTNVWSIVHNITLERVPLAAPVGEYVLEWLGGDFSVCDTGSDRFFEGENLFSKLVVTDTKANAKKVVSWSAQKQRWRVVDLNSSRADYKNMRITIFVGPTRATHEINVARLKLPRHSHACLYWEATRMYVIMGLDCQGKVPSKWVWRSKQRWVSFLTDIGLQDQLLESTRSLLEESADANKAFLPYTAIATAGLLVLLAVWRLDNPRAGGLRNANARVAASAFLHGLARALGSDFKGTLRLCLQEDRFEVTWPARLAEVDVSLVVQGTDVSLNEWRSLAARLDAPVEAASLLEETGLKDVAQVPLASLLEKLVVCKDMPNYMIYQVASQVGKWIDTALFRCAERKATDTYDGALAKFASIMDVENPNLLNSFLWRHVQGGIKESHGSTCLALTTDSGHCGMKLDVGFFVHQSGRVSLAVPQVPIYFTKPAECSQVSRGQAQKVLNNRHLAWIQKFQGSGKIDRQPGWRPQNYKRTAAQHWLHSKDNMIRVGTEWSGLKAVVPDESAEWSEASWQAWRHLQLCQDRGADGVCAVNCLLYAPKIRANITAWYDESHDLENDLYGTFKSKGLYPFMLVLCVVMNLAHGCERDRDLRYWQFVDMLKFVFEQFEAETCASFAARCRGMLEDLGDKVPMDGRKSPMQNLWDFEKDRSGRPSLNERVNMVRFLSWPAAGRDLLRERSSMLWKVELLCVECDWLHSSAFKAKLALKMQQLQEDEARQAFRRSLDAVPEKLLFGQPLCDIERFARLERSARLNEAVCSLRRAEAVAEDQRGEHWRIAVKTCSALLQRHRGQGGPVPEPVELPATTPMLFAALRWASKAAGDEWAAKALYRRAVARERLGYVADAVEDLEAARALRPSDGAITAQLAAVRRQQRKVALRPDAMFAGIFERESCERQREEEAKRLEEKQHRRAARLQRLSQAAT